ncbi:type 2 periplasmic-binding domain-containing protein [[Mycoplasma] testudinis]|uniref:hypothetical protein n=1 Tax=[Mycoplasma] testudinis TaxID=33924 RepID=UPI0004805852|nr:hypothetical protein [[Mycoplasma] testudinis]
MAKKIRNKKYIGGFGLLGIGFIVTSALSSCVPGTGGGGNFVFGNYESYMSSDLQSRIQDTYGNVQFDFYSSNENMISNFKNATYTIGIPSTYAIIELAKAGDLVKLDWSKFNLKDPDTHEPIKTADEALSLFSVPIQQILTDSAHNDGIPNLLEYSVPYFFQNYIFAYRGAPIPEFTKTPDNPNFQQPTFSEILNLIGTKYKDRFDNGRLGVVEDERTLFTTASIVRGEDRLASGLSDTDDPILNNLKPSIADYEDVYNSWKFNTNNPKDLNQQRINPPNFGNKPTPLVMNSDSNAILNALARPIGSAGSLGGAFMFNGDAIFAGLGGDALNDKLKDEINGDNFHIVTPVNSSYALDSMVINKLSTDRNSQFLDEAYNIIRNVGLEGADIINNYYFTDDGSQAPQNEQPIKVGEGDEAKQEINGREVEDGVTHFQRKLLPDSDFSIDDKGIVSGGAADPDFAKSSVFQYGPMMNFDFVFYTSPLRIISHVPGTPTKLEKGTFIPDSNSVSDSVSVVFPGDESASNQADVTDANFDSAYIASSIATYSSQEIKDLALANELQNAYNISIPQKYLNNNAPALSLEQPTNDFQKQALINAFYRFKESLR